MLLSIKDLCVSIDAKNILTGISLDINTGELHAIMGPNGSGKSTLSNVLMGHPKYKVKSGSVMLSNSDLLKLSPDQRAKKGLFLAFQYPQEIEGVTLYDLLRQSHNALYVGTDRQLGIKAFREKIKEYLELLEMDSGFVDRHVNVGFSGGEKKKTELLQFAVLQPKIAIFDEIDSGLDVDALRAVCNGINKLKEIQPEMSFLIITHYQRILNYVNADCVHVMQDGVIVKSGDSKLALEIEASGYN